MELASLRPLLAIVLLATQERSQAFELPLPGTDRVFDFSVTESVIVDRHWDNHDGDPWNDQIWDIRNRLVLDLALDEFSVNVRADAALFPEAPALAFPPYQNQLRLEKATGAFRRGHLEILAGDFAASLGRGIALDVRKLDSLGLDTTLLGARARTDLGRFELTALSGLSNPSNLDPIDEKPVGDPHDWISGLEVAWRLRQDLRAIAHGVVFWFNPLDQNDRVKSGRTWVGGMGLQARTDWLDGFDFYAEVDWRRPEGGEAVGDVSGADGLAGYLMANLAKGALDASLEMKSYRRWTIESLTPSEGRNLRQLRLEYVSPPTLEPENMEIRNNHDVNSASLTLGLRPGEGKTRLEASYAGFYGTDPAEPGSRWLYHLRLGLQQDFFTSCQASLHLGFREDVPQFSKGIYEGLLYLDAALAVPLGVRHSLQLKGFAWWLQLAQGTAQGMQRWKTVKGDWTLSYHFASWLGVSMLFGYDTSRSRTRDLASFFVGSAGESLRQVFLAGGLDLTLLDSRLLIRLLAGSLRGGLRCIAGGCREVPPFEGVRAEVALRF